MASQSVVKLEGLMIENDQLRKDNEQLHKLLFTVSQPVVQNHISDSAGRISHIGGSLRSKTKPTKQDDLDTSLSPERNLENWIPGQAMQIANDFRVAYGNDLSSELITELLRNLNKIWREREKKQISRLRAKYTEELAVTRRTGNSKIGWDSLHFKKSLANLSMKLNAV